MKKKNTSKTGINRWFTSDHHFGHYNVIGYCDRPFMTASQMDGEMMDRWNKLIQPEDEVWYLGDFSFQKFEKAQKTLNSLNGTKLLVRGNHDKGNERMLEMGFKEVYQSHNMILKDGTFILMSHYPYRMMGSNDEHKQRFHNKRLIDKGSWLLCGHVHEKWTTQKRMINVGVDRWDFYPVSEDKIIDLIKGIGDANTKKH